MSSPNHTNGSGSGRRVPIVVGAALVAISLVALVVGGVLVGAHATQRDADGYYTSNHSSLSTPTRAFYSDELEIGNDELDWLFDDGRLGTLRLTAAGTEQNPVFVGIAHRAEVNAYLGGVERDEITDLDVDPLTVTSTRHAGTATPAPPASKRFWVDSASGAGEQSIDWPIEQGNWAVVIMNPDGSPGVATEVSVGAKVGFVLWLGIALLGVGAVLLAAAIAALVTGGRMPPQPAAATGSHLAPGGAAS